MQFGVALKRARERTRGVRRPEILIFQVHQSTGAAKRFEIRPGDAALTVGREGIPRPVRRVGAEDLHGVRPLRCGVVARGWQRIGVARLVGQASDRETPRIAMVERGRVVPAFTEGVRELADCRP